MLDDTSNGCCPFQSTLPARGATESARRNEDAGKFQSTLPARGATARRRLRCPCSINFNPRSPHGERLLENAKKDLAKKISIHAPRTGSDEQLGFKQIDYKIFQSTLPARGATARARSGYADMIISIHAPRTGSDDKKEQRRAGKADFNPRSPHGERQIKPGNPRRKEDFNPRSPHGERHCTTPRLPPRGTFQSTLPARGATHMPGKDEHDGQFQSTLPARGATLSIAVVVPAPLFQSTLPARGATFGGVQWSSTRMPFQSTLPARGATSRKPETMRKMIISIHAPRTGSDQRYAVMQRIKNYFNPRSPHGERLRWWWRRKR